MAGVFDGKSTVSNRVNSSTPAPASSPSLDNSTVTLTKADLVQIPGGVFMMGRNNGNDNERPEHKITVKDFAMDRNEVTNAEYYEFTQDADYMPGADHCAHWINGKPISGQEQMPVRFVNSEDTKAFAAWRSERDGVKYRLPTEQEWEYAARNGGKGNLYPWGDKFDTKCAVLDQPNNDPRAVGSTTCANTWGVKDLIGNVFEWTASDASLYPGSTGEVLIKEPHFMVRGGAAFEKSTGPNAITSTFRVPAPYKRRSAGLGFRLVRSE